MDDVERVALALTKYSPWSSDDWAREAQEVIAVLTDAGWRKIGPDEVVVPREPTDDMRLAANRLVGWDDSTIGPGEIYSTMIEVALEHGYGNE